MPEVEVPYVLQEQEYEAIRRRMIDQDPLTVGDIQLEQSFAGNMAKIVLNRPEVFLFTHKSAIPLADSVRAYYGELGVQVPELAIVNTKDVAGANSETAQGSAEWNQRARSYHSGDAYRVMNREIAKLAPIIEGSRVAILDQYIYGRTTILGAKAIAIGAGAASVSIPDSARWYHDALAPDIDFYTVSSRHAPFMRAIGYAAARSERRVA
jgi:hypothetical protein